MTGEDRVYLGLTFMNSKIEQKNWLVAYVQSNREKKTYDRLTALGIEAFLPLQEEVHQWSDRRKKVQKVIIPMYIRSGHLSRTVRCSSFTFGQSFYGFAWREHPGHYSGITDGTL